MNSKSYKSLSKSDIIKNENHCLLKMFDKQFKFGKDQEKLLLLFDQILSQD
jgi:hypothetical protein